MRRNKLFVTVGVIVVVTLIAAAFLGPSILGVLSGSGSLSVLFTDPPNVPSGVSAVYLNYNGVEVHAAGAASDSGWVDLKSSGTIQLTSLANEALTIASATNVPAGAFDAVRFSIVSTSVSYEGSNYTALYPGGTVTISLTSSVEVASGRSAALIIDFTPTVLSSGSAQSPQFNMSASATAYAVPAGSVAPTPTGAMTNISAASWWATLQRGYSAKIVSSTLTPNSFSVTVENTGANSISVSSFEITAFAGSGGAQMGLPSGAMSATFVANPDGSLSAQGPAAAGSYVLLLPGASQTFTYSGSDIVLTRSYGGGSANVVAGNSYTLSLWGQGIYAEYSVTAQA
jgi:hypothetical protein